MGSVSDFRTAVVAYAKLVKTPSTVVSTVIVYGDWVKSTMSLIGGAFGLVGSITYLYLIFIRSSRKGYQKSRTTKKPSSKLVRTFCGPVTAVVLTIAMLAGETVYLVYAMHATRRGNGFLPVYFGVSAPGRSQKSTGKYDERDQICSGQHVGLRGDRCTGDE